MRMACCMQQVAADDTRWEQVTCENSCSCVPQSEQVIGSEAVLLALCQYISVATR